MFYNIITLKVTHSIFFLSVNNMKIITLTIEKDTQLYNSSRTNHIHVYKFLFLFYQKK